MNYNADHKTNNKKNNKPKVPQNNKILLHCKVFLGKYFLINYGWCWNIHEFSKHLMKVEKLYENIFLQIEKLCKLFQVSYFKYPELF